MSQTSPDNTPSSAPSVAAGQPARAASAGQRVGIWLLLLSLAVAALALVASGLLWQRLGMAQQEMARRSQDSAQQAVAARTLAAQAESLTQELQARLTVAEVKLSEVSLQRSQLEELMLSLSRSRDDNLMQDIESAVKLAEQQMQLTGSAQPLLSALQAADQRIARAAQPRLNPVQRAIARDIERIRSASLADLPSLVLRLDELARQADEWPVLNEVGPLAGAPRNITPTGAIPDRATASATVPLSTTTAAVSMPARSVTGTVSAGAAWGVDWGQRWHRAWTDVLQSLQDLVRVSRIDQPEAALLAPEQAFFLRENIKLKLLNARLGLLARQLPSAQADVKSVEAALARYFDITSPQVSGAQKALAQLRDELVAVNLPRPEETLAALATAAGGR